MKLREFLVCAALLISGALATIALFAFVAVMNDDDGVVATQVAAKPVCATSPITVWQDDDTPCDVTKGQELNVAGLDFGTDQPWLVCDDMGGDWVGDGVNLCMDVDT